MLTPSRLTAILEQPHILYEYDNYELEKIVQQYPFFNAFQYLKAIKDDHNDSIQAIRHLYPANPVLIAILKHKYKNTYSFIDTSIADDIAEEQETETTGESISEDVRAATASKSETPHKEQTADDTDELNQLINANIQIPDHFGQDAVSDQIPHDIGSFKSTTHQDQPDKGQEDDVQALMRVMSFSEWLSFLSSKNKKDRAEEESRRNLKAMWQKEKLAKALEDDSDEIPDTVFNMAVNSLNAPDDINNETMAEVYIRQNKHGKAIEIYEKLSLLYPEKSVYFASKIEKLKKEL